MWKDRISPVVMEAFHSILVCIHVIFVLSVGVGAGMYTPSLAAVLFAGNTFIMGNFIHLLLRASNAI